MARTKKTAEPSPKSELPDDRTTVINLKGSTAYSEWLDSVHKKSRFSKATIIRMALEDWAKKNGHSAPPEI